MTRDIACEEIQRVAPHSVALGSDFEPSATYTIRVNDGETSFTTKAAPTEVEAPIEEVTLHVLESDPVQYFLEFRAGVPNTCHTFDRTDVERSGKEITVAVINRVVTGDIACEEIERVAPHSVALGSDFEAGVTYTVPGQRPGDLLHHGTGNDRGPRPHRRRGTQHRRVRPAAVLPGSHVRPPRRLPHVRPDRDAAVRDGDYGYRHQPRGHRRRRLRAGLRHRDALGGPRERLLAGRYVHRPGQRRGG